MSKIIPFPNKKKENLNAVITLLDTCRKLHDEDGYVYSLAELNKSADGKFVLTLVLEKPKLDIAPDIA